MIRIPIRNWFLSMFLMIVLVLSATAVTTTETTETATTKTDDSKLETFESTLHKMMTKGIDWLQAQQQPNGSWLNALGITSMVTWALINAGLIPEEHENVSSAIDYILEHVQPDGSIASVPVYSNYETSVNVVILSALRSPEYEAIVANAVEFLMEVQITEADITSIDEAEDWWLGGFGYGGGKHQGRPDLSNTQFALFALKSAELAYPSIEIPVEVWQNAIQFVTRCQNLQEVNNEPWASNDGGFIYYPGFSKAGDTKSYGSMTAAGIWALAMAGIESSDDRRISAAIDWIATHYTWDVNPGFDDAKALYYYYWSLARALTITKYEFIIDTDGNLHNWFEELASKLYDLQTEDGYWVNLESDWFWENIPELCTAYALLALETGFNFAYGKQILKIELESDYPKLEFNIYDELGRYTGTRTTRYHYESIPNSELIIEQDGKRKIAYISLDETETIYIEVSNPLDSSSDKHSYKLKMESMYEGKTVWSSDVITGELEPGQTLTHTVVVSNIIGTGTLFEIESKKHTLLPVVEVTPDVIEITEEELDEYHTLTVELKANKPVRKLILVPIIVAGDIELQIEKPVFSSLDTDDVVTTTITLKLSTVDDNAYIVVYADANRPVLIPIGVKSEPTPPPPSQAEIAPEEKVNYILWLLGGIIMVVIILILIAVGIIVKKWVKKKR